MKLRPYDPQDEPAFWEHRIGMTMTDDRGVDIILVHNQDGEIYVRDVVEEDPRF